jgi:hypothetical protein
MDIQTVRDNAQEIAFREAGQIARHQAVMSAIDALIPAANRYIKHALPAPRSSGQNAADRSHNYSEVHYLVARALAAIRFNKNPDDVTPAEMSAAMNDTDTSLIITDTTPDES